MHSTGVLYGDCQGTGVVSGDQVSDLHLPILMEAVISREFSAANILPYYRTGRRLFLYQKNTQSTNVLFSPEYYEHVHEPTLKLQRKFYQALTDVPVQHPAPAPDPPQQDLFPDSDERHLRMLAEERRVEQVTST